MMSGLRVVMPLQRTLPVDPYPNIDIIKSVSCPVLVIHGVQVRQAFNYPLLNRFFSIFSRFPRDFWPCSLDSWRPDGENGRKMGENG